MGFQDLMFRAGRWAVVAVVVLGPLGDASAQDRQKPVIRVFKASSATVQSLSYSKDG